MDNKTFYLYKSTHSEKKFSVRTLEGHRIIYFGAKGYQDFTKHKDEKRKELYIARHEDNEDWTKSGMTTAGFWARWLLWNKPTLAESIKDIEERFHINVIYSKIKN
jgi:hypothetical protein